MKRKLVIIDMQNDFNPSESVRKAVVYKIEKARRNKEKIYLTMDTHRDGAYDSMLESKKYPAHCIYGTDGHNLVREVGEAVGGYKDMKVIYKSGFGSRELVDNLIADCAPDDYIEICGVCTDICVISNALMIRSALYNHVIIVDSHACNGTDTYSHEKALDIMRKCNIEVV